MGHSNRPLEPDLDLLPVPDRRGRRPPAHLRDHLPSRRRQDHADREAAAVRRRDPAGRRGQGARASARRARSDWMEIEQQRGISVTTSVMKFEYGGCIFNLLDTPGHEDFTEDTYRTLTAVDSAVMVIDAAKGIEAQTRKLFEVCRLRDVPIMTFINKLDREARDPFELLDEIARPLALDVAPDDLADRHGRRTSTACYDLRQPRPRAAGPRAAGRAREASVELDEQQPATRDAGRPAGASCARSSSWSRGALPAVRPRGLSRRAI